MTATISSYQDRRSIWYGLKDGTILELGDPAGQTWIKFGNNTMTAEQFKAALPYTKLGLE